MKIVPFITVFCVFSWAAISLAQVPTLPDIPPLPTEGFVVDEDGPVISEVKLSGTYPNYVFSWITSEPATSRLEYETKSNFDETRAFSKYLQSDTLVTEHSFSISSLAPGETYYYQVRSVGSFDKESVSETFTMYTPLTVAPTGTNISAGTPSGAAIGIQATSGSFDPTGNTVLLKDASGTVIQRISSAFPSSTDHSQLYFGYAPTSQPTGNVTVSVTGNATGQSIPVVVSGISLAPMGSGDSSSGGTPGEADNEAGSSGVSSGVVPCGIDGNNNGIVDVGEKCTWQDVIKLASNIIDLVIMVVSVAAALSFMYAGFLYLTSAGQQGPVDRAKGIFKKVLSGYIVILVAWVVMHAIELQFFSTVPNARPDSQLGD